MVINENRSSRNYNEMEHIEEVVKSVTSQNEQPISTGIKFLDNAIGGNSM
jgi:hypothetical protein